MNQKIRAFGYVPDFRALDLGDIILVSDSRLPSRVIRATQNSAGFAPPHTIWTHAALYIGRGQVVEAAPFGGVRVERLAKMTFGRNVLVRQADPAIKVAARYEVVIEALTYLKRGYSFLRLPAMLWQATTKALWKSGRTTDIAGITICSQIIQNAYTAAAFTDPVPDVAGLIWPADLSRTPNLIDISIGWLKVAD